MFKWNIFSIATFAYFSCVIKVSLNVIITKKDSISNYTKLAFLLVTRVAFFYSLYFLGVFPSDTHQIKLSTMAITAGEAKEEQNCYM